MRRFVWFLVPAVVGALVVLAVLFYLQRRRSPDCESLSRTGPDADAVLVCQSEYERTGFVMTRARYADALRRTGNLDGASAVANELLNTDARGTGLQILAKIARAQQRTEPAIELIQEARRAHRASGEHVELAKDDQFLAVIQDTQEQYAAALETLDECIAEAHAGSDERIEGYCHLTAARVSMYAGYFEAASQALVRAEDKLTTDNDLAQLWYGRGNLEQELVRGVFHPEHNQVAIAAFEKSLELSRLSGSSAFVVNMHLNLAYSLAEARRTDEADRHLAEAAVLDRNGKFRSDRAQLVARIAYRRGNLSHAYSLNEALYPSVQDEDLKLHVCAMQARIALATNDLDAARKWAQRGVDIAEKIRAAQKLSDLRPWVLASRRAPFELLFIAYARAGRPEDALRVFDQWQGRTLLDQMAKPSPEPSPGLTMMANRIHSLAQWLPAASKAPLMTSDGRAVVETAGRIDLIALAIAEGDVWRVTSRHGRLQLDNLGPHEKLQSQLENFSTTPTDPALASEIGALILPDDLVRKTDEPLYVVLDAPLTGLPFVALRRNGQPLIAWRPVLRAPRLPVASACAPRAPISSAAILADAKGDLPEARLESNKVAERFGTTARVGAAATSTALFAAKSDPLLHVAVHADVDAGGGSLKLYDRTVLAPEISASKLGPQLVVLSGCSTAQSLDPEVAGSLSTAFIAGGAQRVVATLRPVSDTGALELTTRFYAEHGADDPLRTLAKIQAELAQGNDKDWPNFAVFGNDICVRPPT